jgi:hypothetical protein
MHEALASEAGKTANSQFDVGCSVLDSGWALARTKPKLIGHDFVKLVCERTPKTVVLSRVTTDNAVFDVSPSSLLDLRQADTREKEMAPWLKSQGAPSQVILPNPKWTMRVEKYHQNF